MGVTKTEFKLQNLLELSPIKVKKPFNFKYTRMYSEFIR